MDNDTKTHCTNCGKEIPSKVDFCPFCGAKQASSTDSEVENNENATEMKKGDSQKKPRKKWYKRWWIWVIAIILVLAAIGSASSSDDSGSSSSGEPSTSESSSATKESSSSSSSATSVRKSVQVLDKYSESELAAKGATNASQIRYGELIKSNDYYAKPYSISKGEVLQATEGKGVTSLLVYTDDDSDQLFQVDVRGKTKAIEDDYVSINGVLDKMTDYDTQAGGSNTVPVLFANKATVIGHDDDD